jgi:hypothetical protein
VLPDIEFKMALVPDVKVRSDRLMLMENEPGAPPETMFTKSMVPLRVPVVTLPIVSVPELGLNRPVEPEMLVNEKAVSGVIATPAPSRESPPNVPGVTVKPVKVKLTAGVPRLPPCVIFTPPEKLMSSATAAPVNIVTAAINTNKKAKRFIVFLLLNLFPTQITENRSSESSLPFVSESFLR